MSRPLFESIRLDGLLSFAWGSEPIALQGLNVVIGPNGSGKSNLLEAFELLRATPTDLAEFLRTGGGAAEWRWKGGSQASSSPSLIEAVVGGARTPRPLRYRVAFAEAAHRVEVLDESLEEVEKHQPGASDVYFYYRFQKGRAVLNTRTERRELKREDLNPEQSVLAQRRDPDLYPELTAVGETFRRIESFREWQFGRSVALRRPQPADLPSDALLPDLRNLGLVLNAIEHSDRWLELNRHLHRFLPRFKHLSTRIQAGHVQVFLHEDGLRTPVPATRLSDGTIRFIALLAILLRPETASLICLEEPELGLHPDAVDLVAGLLREAAATTQLIVPTHSDALVSALTEEAESVLVAEFDAAQGTRLRRLESDRLRTWMDKYRLGELWRMGELGGNP